MDDHSDHSDDGKRRGGEKKERVVAEQRQAKVPHPRNEKLWTWLQKEFFDIDDAVSGPSKIVLALAAGPRKNRPGRVVRDLPLPSSRRTKPDREKLVEIANELVEDAQADCDAIGKAQTYMVCSYDSMRDTGVVGSMLLRMVPSDFSEASDDDEGSGTVKDDLLRELYRDRRFQQEHLSRMFDSYQSAMDGVIARYEARLVASEAANATLLQTHMELVKLKEELADRKFARELKERRAKFFEDKLEHGINMVERFVLPIASAKLAAMAQASAPPGAPTPLATWASKLTDDESAALFGLWTDGKVTAPGILTEAQALRFLAVADGRDADVDGFAASLTQDQLAAAQQAIALPKLIELKTIIDAMKAQAGAA